MNPADTNKALVRAFVDAVNAHDWPGLADLLAPAFVRHSVAAGEPAVGSASELVRFLEQELATFPDAREELLDLVAEGDKVAARHLFSGTQLGPMGAHPPSGRRMTATYLAIYRVSAGRLAEAWVEWDNLAGLRQLGHAGAFEPGRSAAVPAGAPDHEGPAARGHACHTPGRP
ncbi:MAG: ester cyclase [Rubrivivax sp.]|nr:ester cyclase [Rubrivivax sp.]